MSKQPKPCPFAHPINVGSAIEPINNHFHGVCHDCGAEGPQAETFAEALKAWNARRSGDGHGKQ
ncbi:hypothetical protein [Mesorhizobium sp. M6A.T.Ce.TU.016.01.1.1]|uniref:hypothetical protein n=1 Tax=Mesorhizobium sp. M6A.T.Ce.TU.016.01.1.1 TaxID=2496783 RepID=UPI000FCB2E29|nr:hypothetical protein [Mesorhizobium sp. M6A.T.Ce.TU.016.01.1.1]RUU29723.1 hypothetical protein EOC94_12695 [Mesorhizobium sp. M6A.T.Ce.TU.016.01.1.1]